MTDLETLLRATLSEHADDVQVRAAAVEAAATAVRRRRHRRQGGAAAGAAAAVAAIAVGAVTLWPHPESWSAAPAVPSLATSAATSSPLASIGAGTPTATPATSGTSGTSSTASTGNPSGDRFFLMNSLYGGDFEKRFLSSGFGGDIVLKDGSPSSVGLPAGYSASLDLSMLDATSVAYDGTMKSTIVVLCQPMVEKGATMKACVPYSYGGKALKREETDAPNTKVGTWAASRMLYARPDGKVQMTTMTVFNTTKTTTAHDRALAAAWLASQADKLAALTIADQR